MPYYSALARSVHEVVTARQRADAARIPINECIAPCYYPIHQDIEQGKHTFYYFPGGRGSAKSSFCALEVVQGIMDDPEANGIVFRRYAATMRESTFSQIAWAVETLGAWDVWKGNVSYLSFRKQFKKCRNMKWSGAVNVIQEEDNFLLFCRRKQHF